MPVEPGGGVRTLLFLPGLTELSSGGDGGGAGSITGDGETYNPPVRPELISCLTAPAPTPVSRKLTLVTGQLGWLSISATS